MFISFLKRANSVPGARGDSRRNRNRRPSASSPRAGVAEEVAGGTGDVYFFIVYDMKMRWVIDSAVAPLMLQKPQSHL